MLDWQLEIIHLIERKSRQPGVAISPETPFDELGIESLDQIELIFELEEHFDIELPYNANLPEGQTLELVTVGDLIALVAGQIGQSGATCKYPVNGTEPLDLP